MQTAGKTRKTRLMEVPVATVLALLAAGTVSPASATTSHRTVPAAEAALACATPCNWFSRQLPARIDALKAAELQAKTLAEMGYAINYTKAVQEATTVWKGQVNYQRR
ncbi:hypothetical protein AB0392_37905 [Nonomuraea angiospora]|uniref:hypothetical protein n=1 Tax=Nonomuraea angiospora TaxID=46172 RepID=UPI00344F0E9C